MPLSGKDGAGDGGSPRDYPTRAEMREVLRGLADERIVPDDASDWAWHYHHLDSSEYDECIQDALERVSLAETVPGSGDLYIVEDFRDWLHDFDRCAQRPQAGEP